ncbi:hypothetical protein [Aquimarina celericrescens]|uniref:Metal-dependent HD superfamily phosphohydrolase n=1 Tax=Aquimarina celericrescens TaxID=1964542 RepID=A0ABW5AU90_9FLAO
MKDVFTSLLSKYTNDSKLIELLWKEIENKYNKKNRYYHNLKHLEYLYQRLINVKDQITDWDMVLFALFYHDYVYNVLKKDNEQQSAVKAEAILRALGIENDRVELCKEIILATKSHTISKNEDINFFTDADLSILGSDWENYKVYFKNVRKEYKYYPAFMYSKGRIKVLEHFLNMPKIFKTEHFYQKFEAQAKKNMKREIDFLSK